jgi:release factor glutamine methyltransferase
MARTVRELLEAGQRQLQSVPIENARLAAEIILRSILNLRRIDLYLEPQREVDSAAQNDFFDQITRKVNREPLQYIVGETEWFGLRIKCDRRALVPRPETEVVVEHALALIANVANPRVADIGTGTGCIAIAVAESRKDARVVATDLAVEALSLARENLAMHDLAGRIELCQGESLAPLDPQAKYDLIISNPPYIRESEYLHLMPEVREFEPREALVAGDDGLAVISSLIAGAHLHLKSGGFLVLEFGIDHAEPVKRLALESGRFDAQEIIIDYNGRERGIALRRMSSPKAG